MTVLSARARKGPQPIGASSKPATVQESLDEAIQELEKIKLRKTVAFDRFDGAAQAIIQEDGAKAVEHGTKVFADFFTIGEH
jgi:hypothetical protein